MLDPGPHSPVGTLASLQWLRGGLPRGGLPQGGIRAPGFTGQIVSSLEPGEGRADEMWAGNKRGQLRMGG